MKIIKEVLPMQATLVPDPPGVLTSDSGWNIAKNKKKLVDTIQELKSLGVRSSIFVNADIESMHLAHDVKADAIELYTGPFANNFSIDPEMSVENYVSAAKIANELGLRINAGHDLSLKNLNYFKNQVQFLSEVSIGHAIISDALYLGIEAAIAAYKTCLS